jgi:guanylate kinase
VDYVFVDRDAFERKIREGEFLEWAEVHGHLYGSSLESLRSVDEDHALLFEVDWKGAEQIRRQVEDAILIFVMTPSVHDLVRRIEGRGGISPEELNVRIRTATVEIQRSASFDYLVINDRFEEAVGELHSIIIAGSCRRQVRLPSRMERWSKEIAALPADPPRGPVPSPGSKGER